MANRVLRLVKAQLVFKIDTILKTRGLKQVEAAGLFGVRQPDVSKMLRGEFRAHGNRMPPDLRRQQGFLEGGAKKHPLSFRPEM